MPESQTWTLVLTEAGSHAAGARNDDAWGHTLDRAWVLDGATGVSSRRCTRDSSDAAWLADAASHWLGADARSPQGDTPLSDRMVELQAFLMQAFRRELEKTTAVAREDIEAPCACLGVAQIEGNELALACVGDISVVVRWPDGRYQVWSDHASSSASARTLAAWQTARSRGLSGDALWNAVRPVILGNRHLVNRLGGYRVLHPTRPWASGVAVHRVALQDGMQVLLASDGVWRLVDLFQALEPDQLVTALEHRGWATVLTTLRGLENADPHAQRHPRVKHRDDATAVLARVCRFPKAAT